LPGFNRHVFVCTNFRAPEAARPSCTANGQSEIHTRMKDAVREAGLGAKVRVNKSGCLDQCEHGPTVVVYPGAIWYGFVKPEDVTEIVSEHLLNGRPVERLRLAEGCVNTQGCPHRQAAQAQPLG
jgi:(2Fe-2S) ferredoxin